MTKDLSIIIPRYKETEKDIFPLLAGIAGQCGADFPGTEIIIVTDGGGAGPLDADFLSLFPALDTRQVLLPENGGPGLARQAGIDAAQGRYLMFCDADDTLHSVGVLGALMQEAERSAPDVLTSDWLEEQQLPGGSFTYLTHSGDMTWMHGKLLRREYLRRIGVRHHKWLRVHEDSYFLSIAGSATQRTVHLPVVTYVWKWHPDSITRRDGQAYTYNSLPVFAYAICESFRELEELAPAAMQQRVCQFLCYVFLTFQRPEWSAHGEFRAETEEVLKDGMVPYWRYYDTAAPGYMEGIYSTERARTLPVGMEHGLFPDWVRTLRGKD